MSKEIITCPKCKGKGEITKSDSENFGVAGAILTFGFINLLDAACSKEWQEECPKCKGYGKIQLKFD